MDKWDMFIAYMKICTQFCTQKGCAGAKKLEHNLVIAYVEHMYNTDSINGQVP